MPIKVAAEKKYKLEELIHLFYSNIKQYKKATYDEANTRVDFIDKFFELLEWDVRNTQGYSEAYREVVREDKVIVEGKPKAPDYSFRIGGRKFFFVEAKKPCVNIKEERDPAFQLRRYGYTAKLALSILTDFEEFAVYDTRIKPHKNDSAATARVFYCEFIELLKENNVNTEITNFEYIYSIFSKNAILKGSFDKYIDETKNKKGTSEVDKEILKLIDNWRCELARNMALRNTELDVYNLNHAVQKIIDRIIFLRIAEDRKMEAYGTLKEITEKPAVYDNMVEIFQKAEKKYNSGLFVGEKWLNDIVIDDRVLSTIIDSFYYPECPYELSILPIEILGNAYEQFLGKKIRLTATHQAKIEGKPEVRKAGGVYYTPQYIVDYIVKNTVGEKVKRKKPEDMEKLRILDPACGSGSFLVRAYEYLLKHHIKYYCQKTKIKEALKKGEIYQVDENTYYLSTQEKQRILLNNIFGVDIDEQAVEVTKLSLLLKLMENEYVEYSGYLFKHMDFALLPDLSGNIKCGNSLIGSDFYDGKQLDLFNKEEMRKVNTFDWDKEFAEIFRDGGFDCVIGNPPYFNVETLGVDSIEVKYIKDNYKIWMDKSDILFYFIEKGIKLSKGYIGFIISNAFLFAAKALKLRNYIKEKSNIEKIINFEKYKVFENASITTSIIILNKNRNNDETKVLNLKDKNYNQIELSKILYENKKFFSTKFEFNSVFALINNKIISLNKKIDDNSVQLNSIFKIGSGMQTGANDVFLFKYYPNEFPYKFIKKRMTGEIIFRYYIGNAKEYILYFEDIDKFINLPESIKKYLLLNKKRLVNRADKKRRKTSNWWNFTFPMHKELYSLNKIWCSYRSITNKFVFDDSNMFIGLTNTTVIFGNNTDYSLKYILALLNSRLINFRYKSIGKQTGNGVYEYFENGVGKIPIKMINNFEQNKFIIVVDQMIETKIKYNSAKIEADKKLWKKKIDLLDRQIDNLVYKLYGITDEEIKIVEGG